MAKKMFHASENEVIPLWLLVGWITNESPAGFTLRVNDV